MARATAAAAVAAAAVAVFLDRGAHRRARRRERGKFLVQFRRAAMRTLRPAPVRGAHQDFAVFSALFAMKFVDWHEDSITGFRDFLKP